MSNFIVSARKYRPQRFEDVVGQQHVAGTLKNALATDHVAHAFLFTGPRGVGKTTCARILAKILNCENRTPDHEACNQCSSCTSFNENASFNIIELDAASNNSVEHVRALIEQVRFQPQQGRYKVFIIDEVHMLSNQAFNAFLKTLEEPPPYAIFILATTEKHKIIPTILSRCQIFDFRRITVADMVAHLQNICQQEGITAEPDALHIIAQKADGALRDALSIFDRITSSAGKQIRYADVIENLNVLDYDYYFRVTDAMLAQDSAGMMLIFDEILKKGFDPEVFVLGLAEHLRNLLVCKDNATIALLETGENLRDRYRQQAGLSSNSFLLSSLNLCNECDINFKTARNKRLHVEMALLKMCHISEAIKAAQEKKTPDLNITPKTAVAPTTTNGQHQTITPPPTPAPPVSNGHSGNAHTVPRDQMIDLSSRLRKGDLKAEAIPLSLDAYEQAVVIETAAKSGLTSRLTIDNARSEWKAYAHSHPSKLVQMALLNAELVLEETRLRVKIGTNVDRSHIQAETGKLLDTLRQRLHDARLIIQLELDESKAQETAVARPARPLTVRERTDRMKEQNPSINDLISRFDLKPED